jgi:PadR family transcriptional regulator, regulatory protein PadR
MISKALVAASLKPFVLSILSEGESYGYEIIQRVQHVTGGEIQWTTGTLYPLLHSLENKGLLESFWREAEAAPKRKYYRLTKKGYKALEAEKRQWLSVHEALTALWGPSPALSMAGG